MLSVSTALSGVNSQAKSFYCRSAAEPLADACGTLGFRGTPVENHCVKQLAQCIRTQLRVSSGLLVRILGRF